MDTLVFFVLQTNSLVIWSFSMDQRKSRYDHLANNSNFFRKIKILLYGRILF